MRFILLSLAVVAAFVFTAAPLRAAMSDELQYVATHSHGLSNGLSAGFFSKTDESGYGLNVNGVMSNNAEAHMDINHHDKLTALLVNGTYDLPARLKGEMDVHPFILGGAGVAVYDAASAKTVTVDGRGDMVPLFRVGGGLAYKMDDRLGLSLSYKTGFTGKTLQSIDMQMIDVGLKYRF
jgi:hypothetical protein